METYFRETNSQETILLPGSQDSNNQMEARWKLDRTGVACKPLRSGRLKNKQTNTPLDLQDELQSETSKVYFECFFSYSLLKCIPSSSSYLGLGEL